MSAGQPHGDISTLGADAAALLHDNHSLCKANPWESLCAL